MPNINFDIFFDKDFLNFTATRSQGAPKIKPDWKVRTAPKLPPKELPAPSKTDPRPAPKISDPRVSNRIKELPDSKPASEAGSAPKLAKNIPKLAPKSAPKPKA